MISLTVHILAGYKFRSCTLFKSYHTEHGTALGLATGICTVTLSNHLTHTIALVGLLGRTAGKYPCVSHPDAKFASRYEA